MSDHVRQMETQIQFLFVEWDKQSNEISDGD